jgi:hypothetical protein
VVKSHSARLPNPCILPFEFFVFHPLYPQSRKRYKLIEMDLSNLEVLFFIFVFPSFCVCLCCGGLGFSFCV